MGGFQYFFTAGRHRETGELDVTRMIQTYETWTDAAKAAEEADAEGWPVLAITRANIGTLTLTEKEED